jgi:son of sevenless-like protein
MHIQLDVVKHFTVSSRQKQPVCRDIDLSRAFSKDSKENMLKVIAEQMTLMEFAVYEAVKRRELMHLNWKTRDREEKAPNVCHLIRRTNEMTSWVCTEILMRDSPSSRATVIEHFIQIALYCYRHNDLHCSLNITFALSSSIIRGLRKTWEEVDKKFHEKFKKLRELADHQGRCKKLREKLEKTTWAHVHKTGEIPAALPYIGAYLDQIYSLEMCTKTYNKDNLVNFTKMTKLAHVVARMLMYQKTRFKFEPKLDVIAYMTSAKRLSENDLYELSCQIEPTSKS